VWVIQLNEHFLVWILFLGSAWLLRREVHVTLDLVLNHLKPKPRAWVNIVTSLICAVGCLFLAWSGTMNTWMQFEGGYNTIFVLGDNADNNRIQNCILNGVPTSGPNNSLAIVFCDPTTTTSDNLIISNNDFNDGGSGVVAEGVNTTTLASGTQILNKHLQ